MARAKTPEERERIREQAVEITSSEVIEAQITEISQRLKEAPPVAFDIARQVQVFEIVPAICRVKTVWGRHPAASNWYPAKNPKPRKCWWSANKAYDI